jgi:hypothetical protein
MEAIARLRVASACAAALLSSACSRSNNLLLGRVETTVAAHSIVVTDCYRTRVPQPQKLSDAAGQTTYQFTPCRDAEIVIRRVRAVLAARGETEELVVNGRSYGLLRPTDAVLVDHGVVSITGAN